jgi:hypothetical protein
MGARAQQASVEREWLLRSLLVLQAPRAVFAALRDDEDKSAHARQEPLTALIVLAGMAGVLATDVAGRLYDDPEIDGLLVAVWAFVGGGFYGFVAYWLLGGLVYLAARALGGLGSYRRARHLVGFAVAPLALSLLVLWPVGLALFGGDLFRSGGTDVGTDGDLFSAAQFAFVGWAFGLLAIGVRAVHGWSWPRTLAAVALVAAIPASLILAEQL